MPKKKSKDINELAFNILSQLEDPPSKKIKKKLASVLGRLGGRKGGKARAKKLSKERRKEIAQNAARARWDKTSKNTKILGINMSKLTTPSNNKDLKKRSKSTK